MQSMGQAVPCDPKRARPSHYGEDLKTFINRYHDQALFDYLPGRQHSGLKDYEDNSTRITSPVKFGRHLAQIGKQMDFWCARGQDARMPRIVEEDPDI